MLYFVIYLVSGLVTCVAIEVLDLRYMMLADLRDERTTTGLDALCFYAVVIVLWPGLALIVIASLLLAAWAKLRCKW